MSEEPVPLGNEAVMARLSEAAVLRATVEQLRKDLNTTAIIEPAGGPGAFEELRGEVLPILEARHAESASALRISLYRVDVPESWAREAMARGGLRELAGRVVFRTLQKVLTRLTYRPGTTGEGGQGGRT